MKYQNPATVTKKISWPVRSTAKRIVGGRDNNVEERGCEEAGRAGCAPEKRVCRRLLLNVRVFHPCGELAANRRAAAAVHIVTSPPAEDDAGLRRADRCEHLAESTPWCNGTWDAFLSELNEDACSTYNGRHTRCSDWSGFTFKTLPGTHASVLAKIVPTRLVNLLLVVT
jgi:hypothetical protein